MHVYIYSLASGVLHDQSLELIIAHSIAIAGNGLRYSIFCSDSLVNMPQAWL